MELSAARLLTLVWALLLGATAATGWLAGAHRGQAAASAAIVLIAALKLRLILWHFMELRGAPLPWRAAAMGWLGLVTALALCGNWLMG
jgi:hypothetical protein